MGVCLKKRVDKKSLRSYSNRILPGYSNRILRGYTNRILITGYKELYLMYLPTLECKWGT